MENTDKLLIAMPCDPVLRHIVNPVQVQLSSTIRNVIGIDVLSFGAVGLFNPDRSFVALAMQEIPGADWIAVGYGIHSWRPLGIFTINDVTVDRVSHHGTESSPLARIRFPKQKLPQITLAILKSNGSYDTRIIQAWMELVIHYEPMSEVLQNYY